MAALPSISQVAGAHIELYEKYYNQVDKNRTGSIAAFDAANFLKKSELSDYILSKVWDLSDPTGKGSLDKQGFFVALKLVALSQNNKDVSMANIILDVPPPKMGDVTDTFISPIVDWTIKVTEQLKFEKLFDSLGPINGRLPGSKVKPVMLNSKLPMDVLGRVWDLSDMDNDGFLDKEEFVLAMHLIYKALENHPVPTVLPPELIPPTKREKNLIGAVPVLPPLPSGVDGSVWNSTLPSTFSSKLTSNDETVPWVVSPADKTRYDGMFLTADLDEDGFVNGMEIKDLFLKSGLPQQVLAHIWNLCDTKQTGKLNMEEFALAMHLVQQKLQGNEIPSSLPPEMIPPSMRTRMSVDGGREDVPLPLSNSTYSNPELEMINNEINDLSKEKHQIEQEVIQKEADIGIKKSEVKNIQNELDTLSSAIKQLETQKGEAQKRLDDLDTQQCSLEHSMSDLKKQLEEENTEVNILQKQLKDQKTSLKEQELELNSKRQELNGLRQEETKLEQQIETNKNQLNTLCKTLEQTQLQISQAKTKIIQLQDQQDQLNNLIAQYDSAISSGDAASVSEIALQIAMPLKIESENHHQGKNSVSSPADEKKELNSSANTLEERDNLFQTKDPFCNTNGFIDDPFSQDDPFKNVDPFQEENNVDSVDPFKGSDPFNNIFGQTINEDDFKHSDFFPGTIANPAKNVIEDPFDPFGVATTMNNDPLENTSNGDLFGSDPFAPQAVSRSESPTPALPPKKSKQPPPRPAPPKNSGMKMPRAAPPAPDPFSNGDSKNTDPFITVFENDPFDPFSSSAGKATSFGNTDQFADFANFDKFYDWGPSEEDQLAWATVESLRLEEDRRKEEAEFELAMALSRAEVKKDPC